MQFPYKVICGDSSDILRTLPSNSIDSLVTDPPAGIGLLRLGWDSDKGGRDQWIKWLSSVMQECYRAMKPGAYGFVWAIPRTSHWTATALEDAGFHIKDVITHVFGSGFPKSMAIDKMIANAKRVDLTLVHKVTGWIRLRKQELSLTNKDINIFMNTKGSAVHWTAKPGGELGQIPSLKRWRKLKELLGDAPQEIESIVKNHHNRAENPVLREKLTEAAGKWKGFGTGLKPASEHWILIQKPVHKNGIAANILNYGVGALNIDESRIATDDLISRTRNLDFAKSPFFGSQTKNKDRSKVYEPHKNGRFPANLVLTRENEEVPMEVIGKTDSQKACGYFKNFEPEVRSIYCPKPTKAEKGDFNSHPTVKPLGLMQYLIKMITPSGGVVLDPFMGSGTTGVAALREKHGFVGIEKEPEYLSICKRRFRGVLKKIKRTEASPSQIHNPGLPNIRKLSCPSKPQGGS